ncbi:hypothetical protein COLO4_24148 [Corchorus olitorius]|uniref:F-box domain-containing protein n=1 Tax=Corchorus olitorius TaxID=93759 RepID=A0A1R3ICM2_9ROSI|nr:hypothetical protein COLO4_24148 [Corchorus olitorius]
MDYVTNYRSSKSQALEQDDDFDGKDRISELPDEILLEILSYLPMKDIIAASAMSSRWKDLWKFFPSHNFNFTLSQIVGANPLDGISDMARIPKFRLRDPTYGPLHYTALS